MKRRALLIGVDQYAQLPPLTSCRRDATAMAKLLSQHHDGSPNYACHVVHDCLPNGAPLTRAALRGLLQDLFASPNPVLFYFSGHGAPAWTGGLLCTVDAEPGDWGVPMNEIVELARQSPAPDVLIILDCCHSGDIGDVPTLPRFGESAFSQLLRDNVTIMAASRAPEVAVEDVGGHGMFTAALLDALAGGAAEHMGWVTAPAMYAYAERRFSGAEQQPVYKSYTTRVITVRQCAPLIDRMALGRIVELFPHAAAEFPLDPEYEPEVDDQGTRTGVINQAKVELARLFKSYRDTGLVTAVVPGEDFFWTAKRWHALKLTPRGREYWDLVKCQRI